MNGTPLNPLTDCAIAQSFTKEKENHSISQSLQGEQS